MEKMTYRELTTIITQLNARMNEIDTFMAGIVAILGKDEILTAAKEYAEEQVRHAEETMAAQVAAGVKDGWLKETTVSGLQSLVVGYETLAGQPARRMQVVPGGLPPADRGSYIGRAVGEEFIVSSPLGPVTTKIAAVYEVDEERRREVIAEHQAKLAAEKTQPLPPPAADKVDDIV